VIVVTEMPVPVAWVGHAIGAFEATGARVAFLTRLGEGTMARTDLLLQDGDVLHVVTAEAEAPAVQAALAAGPEEH
jgi:trk system potassium uptake protein TrkA